jgi:hypothetical protein
LEGVLDLSLTERIQRVVRNHTLTRTLRRMSVLEDLDGNEW